MNLRVQRHSAVRMPPVGALAQRASNRVRVDSRGRVQTQLRRKDVEFYDDWMRGGGGRLNKSPGGVVVSAMR